MKKHKNTLKPYDKLTIIFGYSLFALTVLSFFIFTALPWTMALQHPGALQFNIIVMIVVFAVTTILPALISYAIGDRATHNKNKTLHHYNGVLFGVAAFWVARLFSWPGFDWLMGVADAPHPIPMIVSNVIPVTLTIITMALVAIAYAKKQRKNTSILEFQPFQILLIASVSWGVIGPIFSGVLNPDMIFYALGFTVIPLVAVLIAYNVLVSQHKTFLARLSDAIVAMSIAWISIWLAGEYMGLLQWHYQITSTLGYIVGLVVFVAYLHLRITKR